MIAKKPKFLKRVTVLPLFKIKGVSWLLYGGGVVSLGSRDLKSVILGVNGGVIWLGVRRLRTFVKSDKKAKILIIRLNI